MERSWRTPTVAMSARARTSFESSALNMPASARSRLSAPITSLRSRSGTLRTDANPTSSARSANVGQRTRSASSCGEATTSPVRNASRQGPSLFCSSNSSSRRVRSLDAATACRLPDGAASMTPASVTSASATQRSVSVCRKSMTS